MTAPTHRAAVLEPNCSQASDRRAEIEKKPSPTGDSPRSDDEVERLPLVVFVLREFGIGLTFFQGAHGALYQLRRARQKDALRIQGCDARVPSRLKETRSTILTFSSMAVPAASVIPCPLQEARV
jgi:hypothetical protein